MEFVPEEKEERKWILIIGFSMVSGGLFIVFLSFLYLSLRFSIRYSTLVSLLLVVICICILPFVLGFQYGKRMPFQANRSKNICLKGGFFVELLLFVPFIVYPESVSFLTSPMAVFGLIFYFLILLIPATFCGLGGYYGAQFRARKSKATKGSGK